MSKVFLDISIDSKQIGRIVCQLFNDEAPKASDNFFQLCTGGKVIDGRPLCYKRNQFHRVVRNFMVQAGDLIFGSKGFEKTDDIGKGGCSIYATDEELRNSNSDGIQCFGNFEDENLGEFTESFMLAMANTGSKNTNSSQFFITTYPSPHLNGKHSIFGKVIAGKSVVRTIEFTKVDEDGFPAVPIVIENCGQWRDDMGIPLYNASNSTIGGDIFEEHPEDDFHFGGEDFPKAFEASNTIKESGTLLYKQKDFQNALFKYLKALRYTNEYIPEPDVNQEYNKKFGTLKIKLYLNICLMYFNLKQYDEAITYASYVLDTDNAVANDKAKAFFRRGNCYSLKNRLDLALRDYVDCKELSPDDEAIDQKITLTEKKVTERHEKTKKSISKFFN